MNQQYDIAESQNPRSLKGQVSEAWEKSKKPIVWWIAISILALTFAPNGWKNFLERMALYYDAGNYTTIAQSGYVYDGLAAFYPLWPIVIRAASWIVAAVGLPALAAGWMTGLFATFLFLLSAVVFVRLANLYKLNRYLSFVMALLILSPLSLFRVLPFTESMFSLLLMLLLKDLIAEEGESTWLKCGVWAVFLSATRPMFPFLMISALLLGAYVYFSRTTGFDQVRARELKRSMFQRLAAVFVAAPLGYLPFGFHCLKVYGNFWKPFAVQSQWGRKFGFYWDLIFSPKVINGSNEVLVWDLVGFYAPLVLFTWGLWAFKFESKISLRLRMALFYCALIGCAHSAAAFLTYERFMSIGRHVLANPLPFFGLLIALQFVPERQDRRIRRALSFFVFASAIFLGMWWFRFAKDQWIG